VKSLAQSRVAGLWREFLYTVLFNTVIALFLWSLGFGAGLAKTWGFSQCIGLSIFASVRGALCLAGVHPLLLVSAGLAVGSVAGTLLGSWVTGKAVLSPGQYGQFAQFILFGLLFGTVIVHFFRSRERAAETQAALQEERIRNLANEKRMAEARLKLLQAQVEPHFLFNTLSTVRSLMDVDADRAKVMLESLTAYLRGSLAHTREGATTLGEELEMVRAYLGILGVRMGSRLRYTVEAPDDLLGAPFAPMLLQPLVENAIRHGLDPLVEGGELSVRGEQRDGRLRIVVEDTGRGFQGERSGGTGLQNVRDRVHALYGDEGRLLLEENEPRGVRAILEVPRG